VDTENGSVFSSDVKPDLEPLPVLETIALKFRSCCDGRVTTTKTRETVVPRFGKQWVLCLFAGARWLNRSAPLIYGARTIYLLNPDGGERLRRVTK